MQSVLLVFAIFRDTIIQRNLDVYKIDKCWKYNSNYRYNSINFMLLMYRWYRTHYCVVVYCECSFVHTNIQYGDLLDFYDMPLHNNLKLFYFNPLNAELTLNLLAPTTVGARVNP